MNDKEYDDLLMAAVGHTHHCDLLLADARRACGDTGTGKICYDRITAMFDRDDDFRYKIPLAKMVEVWNSAVRARDAAQEASDKADALLASIKAMRESGSDTP